MVPFYYLRLSHPASSRRAAAAAKRPARRPHATRSSNEARTAVTASASNVANRCRQRRRAVLGITSALRLLVVLLGWLAGTPTVLSLSLSLSCVTLVLVGSIRPAFTVAVFHHLRADPPTRVTPLFQHAHTTAICLSVSPPQAERSPSHLSLHLTP